MRLLAFVCGAAIGSVLRYVIDSFFRNRLVFPWGILIVNVVGSFVLGLNNQNYLIMGFCGAFTTWSAFMLDIHQQIQSKAAYVLNAALTFTLSIAAVAVGVFLSS